MSLKLDGFLRSYRGKPGDDFDAFWEKFQVLSTISKWDTDAKKMQHLPLCLDGDAFLVFCKLPEDEKKVSDTVKKRLSSAFAVTSSQAYGMFVSRRLKADESVDAYVADLQRLLTLPGDEVTGNEDTVVIEQPIAGLSPEFARSLRMAMAGKTLKIDECVEQVRALRATTDEF